MFLFDELFYETVYETFSMSVVAKRNVHFLPQFLQSTAVWRSCMPRRFQNVTRWRVRRSSAWVLRRRFWTTFRACTTHASKQRWVCVLYDHTGRDTWVNEWLEFEARAVNNVQCVGFSQGLTLELSAEAHNLEYLSREIGIPAAPVLKKISEDHSLVNICNESLDWSKLWGCWLFSDDVVFVVIRPRAWVVYWRV